MRTPSVLTDPTPLTTEGVRMGVCMTEKTKIVTLRELSEALSLTVEAARARVRRREKSGEWRILKGNHPNDLLRIELPADALNEKPKRRASRKAPSVPPTDGGASASEGGVRSEGYAEVAATFRALLTEKEKQVVDLTERLLRAEIDFAEFRAAAAAKENHLSVQVDQLEDVVHQLRNRGWLDRLLKR